MKNKIILAAVLFAPAFSLQAQMTMSSPPASDQIQVAASAVYGFDLKDTGISVEGGKLLAPGHFFGIEGTYFHLEETDSFGGVPVNSREHLSTILALYRFEYSLPSMADLSLYIGGGAGIGIVRLSSDYPVLRYSTSDRSNSFGYEGQAGIKWRFNKSWGVKAAIAISRSPTCSCSGSPGSSTTISRKAASLSGFSLGRLTWFGAGARGGRRWDFVRTSSLRMQQTTTSMGSGWGNYD